MLVSRLPLVLLAVSVAMSCWAEAGKVFDAEEAAIHQATVYSDPNARGGQAVGAFGDRAGAYIEFEHIPAADRVNVHYNNGTGKAQQGGLYIDGKRVKTLVFHPTKDWFSPFETASYEGAVSGTVRIQIDVEDFAHNGTFACNVDAISLGSPDFYRTTVKENPYDKPYEWADNQPEDCPFPQSKEITKVVFTGRHANYTKADTWFPMWAADGNEYSPFTDGTVDGYMSVGHYTNMHKVYENKNHRTGQARMVGDDPMSLKVTGLGSMSTNYDNFYPCASVIADGVWYYGHYDAFNETGYFAGWRYSTNWNHFTEAQNYPWKDPYWTCAYDVSEEARHFDFGVADEVEPGHIAVNARTLYSAEQGYGWDAAASGDLNRDAHAVKTMKDFTYGEAPRTFKVDVPDGEYRVLVFMGDRGDVWRDKISVSAEGVLQINNMSTKAGDPGREVIPFEFNVTVEDGQLDLLFQDGGGDDPHWVVNALYVRPVKDDNFFDEKGKAKFRVPRAVVFGQDNRLSPDGKVYLVSHGYSTGGGTNNWANGDAVYLCRVDEGIENVTNPDRYEFWTGSEWSSSVEDAGPLLDWPDNLGGATITWNPGLKKYILVVHHNAKTGLEGSAEEHRTIFMEADEITGPYKTIHYMTNWGPGSYFGNIPAKWISEDGKTAWLVIAANCWGQPANPKQNIYACSMHEFRLVTASEK